MIEDIRKDMKSKEKEIIRLRREIAQLQKEKDEEDEEKRLKRNLFNLKHRKLIKTARIIEKVGARTAKGMAMAGKGVMKAGKRMDSNISKKENLLKQKSSNINKDRSVNKVNILTENDFDLIP